MLTADCFCDPRSSAFIRGEISLLLFREFAQEGLFIHFNELSITSRIDEWVRSVGMLLRALGFQIVKAGMRAEEDIGMKRFQFLKGLLVVLCDLRILLVVHQFVP